MGGTGSIGAATNLLGNAANLSGSKSLGTDESSANSIGKVFDIAYALLCPASDEGSASAKAAQGTASISDVLSVISDIMSRLKDSTSLFDKNKQKINSSNKKCQNIGNQGTAQLSKSVSLVNGNGDMVGLNVNVEESNGNDKNNKNNLEPIQNSGENESSIDLHDADNEGDTSLKDSDDNKGENSVITEKNNSVSDNINSGENLLNENKADDSQNDDNEQVYSCDWGNGAKSNEEISGLNKNIEENEDNNIANNNKVNADDINNSSEENENKYIGENENKTNKISEKDELCSKNKAINDKLKDLKNQKNNILDKQSESEDDDELDELKQRVQTDSEGVQAVDSENNAALSKEAEYKDKINSNVKSGQNDLKTADNLTNKAKSLADSGITSLGVGIASNVAAVPLFACKWTYAGGVAAAAAGAAANVAASGLCESASSVENNSVDKQNSAENKADQTIASIIPQFQQSVQQRLANNMQSVQVQADTRKEIEKKKSEMSGSSSDSTENNNMLANIKNQENMLLMQKSGTQSNGETSESYFPLDFIA